LEYQLWFGKSDLTSVIEDVIILCCGDILYICQLHNRHFGKPKTQSWHDYKERQDFRKKPNLVGERLGTSPEEGHGSL